jgi:cytochrome P450
LGAAFAGYEMAVVLGTLLSRRRFTLDEPAPVTNAFRIGTYGPATGVRLRASTR